jgi:G6PDH family F420-dependent oxidoreductase
MVTIGYTLSSEEFPPNELVRYAKMAEDAGFEFALISDHYHPWTSTQGQSPFVWSVIGGISQVTERLRVGTGVTCPLIRYHPAVIAQAAATAAVMMPGRFFLGVGTGENLNEHILGEPWPEWEVRAEMLEESVEIMRQLWQGGYQSYHGQYYTVENAYVFTRPEQPIEVMVAAAGPRSGELSGRLGDGLISTVPEAQVVQEFEANGGVGKPKYAQMTVCWAADRDSAIKTAHKYWGYSIVPGISQELPLPYHFEQAGSIVTEEMVAEQMTVGPDPQVHIEKLQSYIAAGFDHVYIHQIGPDQAGFMDFYQREVMPHFGQA